MFDTDPSDLDAKATLEAAARLHEERCRVDVEMIEYALHFADLHPDPAVVPGHVHAPPGGERGKVYGGQGCPGVAEFAPAEFGVAIGRSKVSAALFMGQALALRHRLPLTWAQVRAGHGEAWKALQVAKASMSLSEEGAAIVDQRVAHLFDGLTPLRLANIVKAVLWQVDPVGARAEAERKARERGVWAGRTDEHGTTMLFVKAATGDVIRFGATVRQVADALAALGDQDSLNQRRAKAIGILADPAYAHRLLEVAQHLTIPPPDPTPKPEFAAVPETSGASCPDDDPASDPGPEPWEADSGDRDDAARTAGPEAGMDAAARRVLRSKLAAIKQAAYRDGIGSTGRGPARTVLYAHLTDATLLAGDGVARIEGFGPALVANLGELLGHDQVVVQPVIDLKDTVSVDAYEIPHRIRERVKLSHPVELFPYGSAETGINTDLDHIKPYRKDGPPGQTSTRTLAPLGRLSHRIKTHGGWTATRLDDDTMEWITRYGFKFHVTHLGTHRIRRPDESGDSWHP